MRRFKWNGSQSRASAPFRLLDDGVAWAIASSGTLGSDNVAIHRAVSRHLFRTQRLERSCKQPCYLGAPGRGRACGGRLCLCHRQGRHEKNEMMKK